MVEQENNKHSYSIIIGSQSLTRKQIVESIPEIKNSVVIPAYINEASYGNRHGSPESLVLELGQAKATALLKQLKDDHKIEQYKGWFLLTGDQVVVFKNRILEKPTTFEEAITLYHEYCNDPQTLVSTIGSIVLTDIESEIQVTAIDESHISFISSLSNEDIEKIVPSCMNCAGGLKIEHPNVEPHIKIIKGTQESVLGLSKHILKDLLKQLNSEVEFFKAGYSCCSSKQYYHKTL